MIKPKTIETFFVFSLIYTWLFISPLWVQHPNNTAWDNFGYYMLLPQTFIQNDPGNKHVQHLDSIRIKYNLSPSLYQVHGLENGYHMSQYPMGMAVFHFPAFLTGHLAAKWLGYDADGYSLPYQWSLIYWHTLYMALLVLVLFRLFRLFFNLRISLLLLLLTYFATNFFLYSFLVYCSVHSYLFLGYALLLYYTVKWHAQPSLRYALGIGLVSGLMTITRTTEVIALLIPFLWQVTSFKSIRSKSYFLFATHFRHVFLLCVGFLTLVSLQLVYWKYYTGSFFYYTYRNPGEGLELLNPNLINFLFSFRKGWFVYTPLMLFSCIGLFLSWRAKTSYGFALLTFSAFNIYLLSCWSCWWYATSFGQRAMLQSYPVFLLGLGFFLTHIAKQKRIWLKYSVAVSMVFFVWLNVFQVWQVENYILSLDRMTKEYYFATFGRTKIPDDAFGYLLVDRSVCFTRQSPNLNGYERTGFFSVEPPDTSKLFVVNPDMEYGPGTEIPFYKLTWSEHAWLRISMEYRIPDSLLMPIVCVAQTFCNHNNEPYAWNGADLSGEDPVSKDGWKSFSVFYLTPEVRCTSDNFRTHVWLRKRGKLEVRNYKVEVFNRKDAKPR